MRQHILERVPEEACGLVAGTGGCSRVVFEVENILQSPVRFRMEAGEQIRAFLEIEKSGMDLLAIYHSHPQGPDQPSTTDLEEFAYPGTPYLIWYPEAAVAMSTSAMSTSAMSILRSAQDRHRAMSISWTCRAFMLSDGGFREFDFSFLEDE
jgi:proteasome lid subunit RPN8/RPN11